jgi:hypothetical protein
MIAFFNKLLRLASKKHQDSTFAWAGNEHSSRKKLLQYQNCIAQTLEPNKPCTTRSLHQGHLHPDE